MKTGYNHKRLNVIHQGTVFVSATVSGSTLLHTSVLEDQRHVLISKPQLQN
jgi:hypothetical protein